MTPLVSLSVYVHTPFCLQRCRYCDFTTFESHEIYSPQEYFKDLHLEISNRHRFWKDRQIQSLYFGGGTPSLVDPSFILAIIEHFANSGFKFNDPCEITIEINPATMSQKNLDLYLSAGINRFSVGAQTFNDRLLKLCGRKHSAQDTRDTLKLLKVQNLNYSFDLLFALPHQSITDLKKDLDEILDWDPPHLSTYCLTVPEGHPMSFDRAMDEEQVEMFNLIESSLLKINLKKYELSNFAKPGLESIHNLSYWTDQPFWGVGLSSHSYDPNLGPYGTRFWNTKSIKAYPNDVLQAGERPEDWSSENFYEKLALNEAMTDTCHMFLRMCQGLPLDALQKFPSKAQEHIKSRFNQLISDGLLEKSQNQVFLSADGQIKSNLAYQHLTFLKDEISE